MTCCASIYPKNASSCSLTSKVDSEIYYGLITLIELADRDYQEGCAPASICEKYNISPMKLMGIAKRLEGIQLINIRDERLYLTKEPQGLWIIQAMSTLKHHFIEK